jgi:DNA-binding transcriptional regulator YiaG
MTPNSGHPGSVVAGMREDAGITLEVLAWRAGVSSHILARWEAGTHELSACAHAHVMKAMAALIAAKESTS